MSTGQKLRRWSVPHFALGGVIIAIYIVPVTERGAPMSLILVAVCAVFAVPNPASLELVWAILTWPFRLAYASARASKSAAQWIARRLPIWLGWI